MFKKGIALLLILVLALGLFACGNNDDEPEVVEPDDGEEITDVEGGFEIAMITDVGSIDDKSFNQGTWEGVKAYAEANNITHKYYQPTEQSDDAYLASIALAVQSGAKVVVTPGFLFEVPIYIAQDLYPEVTFILIDGNPNDGDQTNPDYHTASNAVGVVYAEEQSGYLAGYAAVKDGYTKLGFMGGMAVPAVVRYGYGFAQGAEDAAAELGIDSIDLKYHYTGNFDNTPEAVAQATAWYTDGTEVIFACGGSVGNSVMVAAETADRVMIGVDVDQSEESPTVITSAMKGLSASVELLLDDYYANSFPGGANLVLGADEDGVQLPMATSRFETFSQADYDELYAKLASGEIELLKDEVEDAGQLPLDIVKVTVIR